MHQLSSYFQKKGSYETFSFRVLLWAFGLLLTSLAASAQVATSDAVWCEVMEQALAGQGVQANVRSDISGNNKIVHVTVGNETKRYVLPSASDMQDYSSPVYVIVDAFSHQASPIGFGRNHLNGRMWMGSRSSIFIPDEVYSNPVDADALQARIRSTISRIPRMALVDGEFTSSALAGNEPLLIMKGDIIASQRGEQFKKGDAKAPRIVERRFAYTKLHVELTDYRTGTVIWSTDLDQDNNTSMHSSDPMESVHQSICNSIRNKLTSLFPSSAPRTSIEGSILSIAAQKKDKAETVYVNLGSNHEVRSGDTFTVYAPVAIGNNSGSTSIGTLTVDEVQGGTLSLCKVKKGGKEILTAIQQGATLIVHSKW